MAHNLNKTGSGDEQSGTSPDVAEALWNEARKGAGDDFTVVSIKLDGQDVPDPQRR